MVDTTIKIGDMVRSYDFPGDRDDCYVEGKVTAIGKFEFPDCPRYEIATTRRVISGKEVEVTVEISHVYPPVNGTPKLLGGVCDGVEKI